MIRQMATQSSVPLTAEQEKILKISPGERLRQDQKALNQERKKYNKQRNIEAKLEENQRCYNAWKTFVKAEKERFEEEQLKLHQQLESLQREDVPEEEMGDGDLDLDDIFGETADPGKKELEARIQNAEKHASDAQEALLMMSAQLQQFMAYQLSAQTLQAPPMTPQPGLHQMPQMSQTGPTAAVKASSPQMPKGVRKENLKQVQKATGHKPRDVIKEDQSKADPAAEENMNREVIAVDDEPDAALL